MCLWLSPFFLSIAFLLAPACSCLFLLTKHKQLNTLATISLPFKQHGMCLSLSLSTCPVGAILYSFVIFIETSFDPTQHSGLLIYLFIYLFDSQGPALTYLLNTKQALMEAGATC